MLARIGTIRDWVQWLGKNDRTLRDWAKDGRLGWTGETRRTDKGRMEKLYMLPESANTTGVGEKASEQAVVVKESADVVSKVVVLPTETFAELRDLVKAEKDTPEQLARFARMVEQRRQIGVLMCKESAQEERDRLDSKYAERERRLLKQEAEVDEIRGKAQVGVDRLKGLAAIERRVLKVKAWAFQVAQIIAESEAWKDASLELPAFPLPDDEIASWADVEGGDVEKPKSKRGRKPKAVESKPEVVEEV